MNAESPVDRLRRAVDNQAALGEAEFRMPIMEAANLVQAISVRPGYETPRDANGKVVPLGAKRLYREGGEAFDVDCYMYDPAAREWRAMDADGHDERLGRLSTERRDSWARLEGDAMRSPAEYLRRVPGTEPRAWSDPEGLVSTMALDIVARAKSLAGVVDDGG